MRRIVVALFAFLTLTGVVLALPVYAAPGPEPVPVETATEEVDLGSVEQPAPEAEVQAGTTEPVDGVPADAATLTVSRTGVAEFSLVGVTWAFDAEVTETLVQVRVQDAAGTWGEWTEVLAETADQGAATSRTGAELRGGTSPLWTGPSTGVEVELVTRAGAQPTDVRLDLVDPGTSEADAALAGPEVTDTAHAATTMPPVYSRAQWGADEGIRSWAPEYASTIKAATVHHTADSNNYTADQVPAIMRSIYRYHSVSLGWGDIGYNVIVDKFGRSWEGRAGGLDRAAIGAHAGGFNTGTFGVSMLGNYDVAPVPQVTVETVASIIAWKFSLFGVDPRGTTVLTSGGGGTAKYAKGERVTLPTIFAHRDVGSTACPGRYGFARMDEIRNRATALMSSSDGAPSPEIEARYDSDAGLRALLGAKVGGTRSEAGTVWQVYANGRLYWSAAGGVRLIAGSILDSYLAAGGPSALGAPSTDELGTPDGLGRYNHLTGGGSIYWSGATGAHVVRGAIRDLWATGGWEKGWLAYPTSSETCGLKGGGCFSHFQGGSIYWSPTTGAHVVNVPVRDKWAALGWEAGSLGYPVADVLCGLRDGGCLQQFQGGRVYWSPASGGGMIRGAVLDAWERTSAQDGALGYPVGDVVCGLRDGGCAVPLQRGWMFWSPAGGGRAVLGDVGGAWLRSGGQDGRLGYPVGDLLCGLRGGGCLQQFQGGRLYWSPASGAASTGGAVLTAWEAASAQDGTYGYPVADLTCGLPGAGCAQPFQRAWLLWSPAAGAHGVQGDVGGTWLARGGATGALGFPVGDMLCGLRERGCLQQFQGGRVYWTPATGGHVLRSVTIGAWEATGAQDGPLGYPVTDEVCGLRSGGCYAHFVGGSVYWSPTTGAHQVSGAIRDRWAAQGWENGGWGYPTGGPRPVAGGVSQRFAGGTATWNATTGVISFG